MLERIPVEKKCKLIRSDIQKRMLSLYIVVDTIFGRNLTYFCALEYTMRINIQQKGAERCERTKRVVN